MKRKNTKSDVDRARIIPRKTVTQCARRGCFNHKWEGEAFCLTCIALKHNGPSTSCDNFPALRAPT